MEMTGCPPYSLWNETNHAKYPYNRWGWRDHGYSAFAVADTLEVRMVVYSPHQMESTG